MKTGFWDSEANKFTLYGAVFGLLFPIIATVIQAYTHYGVLTWDAIVGVQRTDPLLWIIDSAPFFLGLFARFAGWRQDQLKRIIQQKMTAVEVEEDKLEDARQFAGVLTFLGAALIGVVLFLAIIWLQSLISTTLAELPPTAPADSALGSAPTSQVALAPVLTSTVALAPQIVVLDTPVATPVPAVVVVTVTVVADPATSTPLPLPTNTQLPDPVATVTPVPTFTPTLLLNAVRLGVVDRSEANCSFFTEVATASWQQLLGVNVLVERFDNVEQLYAALANPTDPQRVDLTLCFVDPTDRGYLRQYPGSLNLIGKAFWQTDGAKLFALRGLLSPTVDEATQRCMNNFLANQNYGADSTLDMTAAQWLTANLEQVTTWLDCAVE